MLLEKFCPLDINTNGELKLRIDANLTLFESTFLKIFESKFFEQVLKIFDSSLCYRSSTVSRRLVWAHC